MIETEPNLADFRALVDDCERLAASYDYPTPVVDLLAMARRAFRGYSASRNESEFLAATLAFPLLRVMLDALLVATAAAEDSALASD